MQRELSAKLTEGLFCFEFRLYNPSVTASRATSLYTREALVPLKRVYVIIAWLADQYTAHLCVYLCVIERWQLSNYHPFFDSGI